MKAFFAFLFGVSTCLADGLSSDGKAIGSNSVEIVWRELVDRFFFRLKEKVIIDVILNAARQVTR